MSTSRYFQTSVSRFTTIAITIRIAMWRGWCRARYIFGRSMLVVQTTPEA